MMNIENLGLELGLQEVVAARSLLTILSSRARPAHRPGVGLGIKLLASSEDLKLQCTCEP